MNVLEGTRSDQKQNGTEVQLIHLFRACDRLDKGYIVREELEELCVGLGISSDDSDTIFHDLDVDNDGRISFDDFSSGFKAFLSPAANQEEPLQGAENDNSTDRRSGRRLSMWSIPSEVNNISKVSVSNEVNNLRDNWEDKQKESVYQAWTTFTQILLDSQLLSLSAESQTQIRRLYSELQFKTVPVNVISTVQTAVQSLMTEMEELHSQNKSLRELYDREKSKHVETLKNLGDEMDNQVAIVEERAQARAKIEKEEEKRKLHEQMEMELAEMKAHLQIYEKVDSWFQKGNEEEKVKELRSKLEQTSSVNRELRRGMEDTTTNLGLLRSDFAQSRAHYEDKCKELHQQREQALQYMHQYEHIKRQLNLVHEANKRLQDTNDTLRNNFEQELKCESVYSRPSSTRSSRLNTAHSANPNASISPRTSPQTSLAHASLLEDSSKQFGIRRLLDDLDSGLSTLPDKCEEARGLDNENGFLYCNDPPSLEQELCNVYGKEEENEDSFERRLSQIGRDKLEENSYMSFKSSTPPPPADVAPQNIISVTNFVPSALQPASSYNSVATLGQINREQKPVERIYKIVMAGDAAVGKTTFITRLCHGVFVPNMASTLGVDYKVKAIFVDNKHMVIQLWDTAGQERFRSISRSYFRRADAILLLYDVTSERSFSNVRQWVQSIEDSCVNKIPLVLCGNKTDKRPEMIGRGLPTVMPDSGQRLAEEYGATFFETSSKSGEGVLEVFVELARQMAIQEDTMIRSSSTIQMVDNEKSPKKRCCSRS